MKPGKIDWETGIVLEWDRRNGEHARNFTINTSLFRLGLTPQAEVMRAERCFQRFPLWVQYSFLVVVMHTTFPNM